MHIKEEEIKKVMEETGADKNRVLYGLQLQPLHNQVVIIKDKDAIENATKGGIILSDAEATARVTGTVVAIGGGVFTNTGDVLPMTVKLLDRVRFRETYGDDFTLFGNEYHCLKEQDIICILPNITQ